MRFGRVFGTLYIALCCWCTGLAPAAAASPQDDALNRFYMLKPSDPQQARIALAEAARRFPDDARIQLEWAYLLLNEGKPAEAYPAFMRAAEQKPDDGALQRQIGFTALQAQMLPEARRAFERALALDPTDELARNQLAFMREAENQNSPPVNDVKPVQKVVAVTPDAALNRFYALKTTDPKEARAILAKAARQFPNDERIQLEWAYRLLQEKKPADAYRAFMLAAAQKPNDGALQRQIGFTALEANLQPEARRAFERALAIDPKDELARNQIAFMLDAEGKHRSARDEFKQLLNSSDPERRLRACESYGNLRTSVDRLMPKPWFGEVYLAPEWDRQTGAGVAPVQLRVGVTPEAMPKVDVYASARVTYDTRSGAGQGVLGPQFYYDNAAIFAGGVRVRPIDGWPVILFAEAGYAYDLLYKNRNRWQPDVRGGIVVAQEWNMLPQCDQANPFAPRFIADFYADAVGFTRYENDVIAYARLRPGYRFYENADYAGEVYAMGAGATDTQNNPDNRFLEGGFGLALRAFSIVPLTLRNELVYVSRDNGNRYWDTRVRLETGFRF